ncbi:MAG TPA: thioredoxin domain-containing protein [Candidatus Brachybacterium merdavium]|uniref:Thioredoxin domain-containing protein n=1 Tax=Candidatus Brachybacterium merdavium TaxID=2838513 RepID=A0A9D2LFG1_9MICO|nr:thioredoxin domain-containing protein [Candidatus Brachybacterium merdavium]
MSEVGADEPSQRASAGRSRWLVPAAILLVMALLIAVVLWMGRGGEDGDTAAPATDEQVEQEDVAEHPSEVAQPDLSHEEARDPDDLLAEGPVDAPVVLVVFTDFQCPYCARWSHETLPELREYVDRGELRIEWRDVNIYGDDSERAARAALAAAKQGGLEEYHDMLFDGGEIRTGAELSEDSLISLAEELGLDAEQFATDMRSEEVEETISANAQQGVELGAMSTPSFLVGGTPVAGAQPSEVFTDMIDEELAEAEG